MFDKAGIVPEGVPLMQRREQNRKNSEKQTFHRINDITFSPLKLLASTSKHLTVSRAAQKLLDDFQCVDVA